MESQCRKGHARFNTGVTLCACLALEHVCMYLHVCLCPCARRVAGTGGAISMLTTREASRTREPRFTVTSPEGRAGVGQSSAATIRDFFFFFMTLAISQCGESS